MPCTLNESFFFLKAFQNPGQAPRSNQEFTQLRRHQQLLTSIHRTLKVTVDVLSLFCINGKEKICYLNSILKCKHFLFSKTSRRRLQDVFSVTHFVFQDLFKTSSRRVCKTSCSCLQEVFKTSSRRLERQKKCYTEDVLKMSSIRLQYVFTKTNVCWV